MDATEAMRLYVGERRRRLGEIQDKELLFCSGHNRLPLRQRGSKPLTSRELQIIVKETARKAGIKEWKNVVPHCLRKTFESVLRSRLTDGGRLDVKTQEYFMGHILAGSMDTYFDKTKVDQLRKEYGKLIFALGNEERASAFSSLQIVAEALDIDFVQLTESRKRELGRDLDGEEKLHFLQEALKQGIRQFRDAAKCDVRLPSMGESSERTPDMQGSVGQTLLTSEFKHRACNGLSETPLIESIPNTISPEGGKRACVNPPDKNSEMRSTQLTLFMTRKESTNRIKSPISGIRRLKPKSKAKTDLSSFLQSTS